MMGFMIYFVINMCFLRFLKFFEKWSELEKIGKNGEKCLAQNPHIYTTDRDIVSCRRDMTEILLKAALNTIQSIIG